MLTGRVLKEKWKTLGQIVGKERDYLRLLA